MNDLIRVLLEILDEYTTGDPADDTVEYDRLQLAQELSSALWEAGWRKTDLLEAPDVNPDLGY